eukprot:CAMPEP_0196130632 /NCGR_PEP_ID=MMETSP0910-20130528/935_1 /TAXON_ID=49265 /ORGANISM="Thalassiosira rotula, Strain GSO102" /LENGTH=240 /DNA_ID=CAMNT_0041389975 /DNA_START=63 /DNA_END=785 /DNA_ORIENTATION=-
MISGKIAIIFGLSAVLAAIGSSPKLRASTKIASLFATHGIPFHVYKALYRFVALSNVDPTTCNDNPIGRNACYLNGSERDANLEEFNGLEEWQKSHVHEWFVLLKNSDDKIDFQMMIEHLIGQDVSDVLSSLTENEFKAAIGAAERSLNDEDLVDDELSPSFEWMDEDKDGVLTVDERMHPVLEDCSTQAQDSVVCDVYAQLLRPWLPASSMSYDEFKAMIVTEGASAHDEVSAQFSSLF